MKKILLVMDTLVLGGSQKVLLECLNIFLKKYEIDLLLINDYGIYKKNIDKKINVIKIFPKYKQIPLSDIVSNNYNFFEKILILFYKIFFRKKVYLWYLKFKSNKLLKNKNYKYLIGFQEGPSNYLVANLKLNSYKIGWFHSDINMLNKTQTEMEKNVYEKLDKIIAVSKAVKVLAEKKYPKISEKIEVLYNPINIEKIVELSEEPQETYINNTINILTIGRFSPEKGYLELIKIFHRLNEYKTNLRLYLIGEGNEEKKLRELIKKLDLEKKVIILGFKENPYNYLKKSDIYVSSSTYEGLPTTLIEAMILDKVIVATKTPGSCEVLKEYDKKYLVLLGSETDFVNKMIMAINDLEINKNKVEKINLEKKFGNKNFIENFEKICKKNKKEYS